MDIPLTLSIASIVVQSVTGVALAVFAWSTYRLSKQVTELRFAPVLELYSPGSPTTGMFLEKHSNYSGVKWEIYLTNPGDVPLRADNISVSLAINPPYDLEKAVWSGIGNLCDILYEEGNTVVDRAVEVNGRTQRKLTVFLCREDKGPPQMRLFNYGDSAIMLLEMFQRRRLGKQSGWLVLRSDRFKLPDKFGKEVVFPRLE